MDLPNPPGRDLRRIGSREDDDVDRAHGLALDVAPALTPLAALGLAFLMLGAAVIHARRGEPRNVAINLVLIALLTFVAAGRGVGIEVT